MNIHEFHHELRWTLMSIQISFIVLEYPWTIHEFPTKIIKSKNKMATNEKYKQSLKYLGGIIFHGLEYLIRHEVVCCFIF